MDVQNTPLSETVTLENVNAMPASTWHWLKMSDTTVELPRNLSVASREKIEVELLEGEASVASRTADEAIDFADALAKLGGRYTERRASAPGDAADRARVTPETELDVPAVSRYQESAIKLEEEFSPADAFKTGMGSAAEAYIFDTADCETILFILPRNARARAIVRVHAADGCVASAHIDAVLGEGSNLDLTLALDSPKTGRGVAATQLRALVGDNARLCVTSTQTLADGYIALENTGATLAENARASFSHTVLGAGESYVGLAGDLLGDLSRVIIDTDYLGAREQVRDFNYELRHRGHKTECNIDANGVLTGASKKTLRGTIDLVHGCKGSQGNERETVLLANDGVENKTVPVILCDEDDVAGNHGATIGHVRPEQLFYLACRGLSQADAENLFIRAKLEDAALSTGDIRIKNSILTLGDTVIPGFSSEFADELD